MKRIINFFLEKGSIEDMLHDHYFFITYTRVVNTRFVQKQQKEQSRVRCMLDPTTRCAFRYFFNESHF
jgi:hypothetical protein